MKYILIGVASAACFIASSAAAHHGAFEYDMDTVVRYDGVVIEHRWKNPHSVTVLETRSESGQVRTITIEGAGPSGLRAVGVTSESIHVGDRVTAVVSPSRRFPDRSAYGIQIIKEDGSIVPLARNPKERIPRGPETSSSIFGIWSPPFGAMMGILNARTGWKYTAKGRMAYESYNPTLSSQAQCIPVSAPWLMLHPVVHNIENRTDHIVIRSDWMGAERKIFMDGRSHPPIVERFQQGHSLGQWIDDALVVDTTNFTDRIYAGLASGSGKHVTEHFSLTPDGQQLQYRFVVDDPEFLAEPATGTIHWDYRPDLEASDVECNVEMARRFLEEYR